MLLSFVYVQLAILQCNTVYTYHYKEIKLHTKKIHTNAHITHDKGGKNSIESCQVWQSVGIDLVPTEMLKTSPVYPFLVKLFNMCFKYGITPRAWQKGIINPIPKSGDKDPRLPLNVPISH